MGNETKTALVITDAIGLVKKGTENYTRKIPGGNIRITEWQKIVLLRTAYILRRTEIYIHQLIQQTYNCPISPVDWTWHHKWKEHNNDDNHNINNNNNNLWLIRMNSVWQE